MPFLFSSFNLEKLSGQRSLGLNASHKVMSPQGNVVTTHANTAEPE